MSKETIPARRGRPRTAGLDEAIVEAALDEMSRVGYARMSVDAVAQRAGTTRPTIYTRYPSKAALATAALESMRRRTPRELTGNTRADLIAELTLFRTGALRPHGMSMLGAVLAEEHETTDLLDRFRTHVVRPRRQNLIRILRAGVATGQIRSGADLELGVAMMIGSLYATYVEGRRVPASWPERVVDAWLASNAA
jgi:AcrR family transcriptional regulator